MAETLTEALRELARERDEVREWQAIVADQEARVAASVESRLLELHKQSLANHKAECDAADARVRELALAAFAETGSKQPAKGVTIRVGKRLVYDLMEASEWAKANAPALFTLNVKAWEKAAPTLPDAPVKVVEEPSVAIAADLSAVLD